MSLASDHRPLAYLERKQGYDGDSPNGHFADAADKAHNATGVHNGMNEEPDIPRFGGDDYDG